MFTDGIKSPLFGQGWKITDWKDVGDRQITETITQVQMRGKVGADVQAIMLVASGGNVLVNIDGTVEDGEWRTFEMFDGEQICGIHGILGKGESYLRGANFIVWKPPNFIE